MVSTKVSLRGTRSVVIGQLLCILERSYCPMVYLVIENESRMSSGNITLSQTENIVQTTRHNSADSVPTSNLVCITEVAI